MMTLDEQKIAVCEKLSELITITGATNPRIDWKKDGLMFRKINWPTEGLAVCHEAEKLLFTSNNWEACQYTDWLAKITSNWFWNATYEQRLEALCRVWFPKRFI